MSQPASKDSGARRALARIDWSALPPCLSTDKRDAMIMFDRGESGERIAEVYGCSKQAIASKIRVGLITVHASQHPDHVIHCQKCRRVGK